MKPSFRYDCPIITTALLLLTVSLLHGATVHVRLLDAETSFITPAMVCITGAEGEVRLPPDGRIMTSPSSTRAFYSGVEFDPDPNWIGPVRKMQGIGDNNDRSYVYDQLPSIPYWKEPVMYQTSGNFSIQLPEGKWRVAVDRGLEHIPVIKPFEVTSGDDSTLEIELERWINLPENGWWSGDVHVHHPTLKDSHRQFLLSYARACDLHVVNALEMGHHQGTDFKQAGFGEKFRVHDGDYWMASGQEEPRSTFGHIIGLNTRALARDLPTYDFYDLAFKRIHEQRGALVGFAHFSWNGCDLPRGFPWYVTTGGLDFIELLQFSKINAIDYYDYLNLGFKLTAAAGSDAPWGSTVGEVRTFVHCGPTLNLDSWFQNLKAGHTFVSNGPALEFTIDDQLPGTELARNAGDKVRIKARVLSHPAIGVPTSLTLVGNEGVLLEVLNPDKANSLIINLERTINQSQWLVVSSVCDNNALAHSSPVYVKVDDRPTWCPDRGPVVIRKQLESIENIAREFTPASDARAKGIHERLNRARDYYAKLLAEMKAYSASPSGEE
ncbi:MAG: CehA/McbA family metallohydrolase [Verrucomicrobiae bacterium]|nr:CehA/McbA family metallohydrolase [Verrucomicrobiae bacterium]